MAQVRSPSGISVLWILVHIECGCGMELSDSPTAPVATMPS